MDKLYSTSLSEYKGTVNQDIVSLIGVLKNLGLYTTGRILDKEGLIAIPVTIKVPLPSGGAVGGIDIREVEPLMVVVNNKFYPSRPPKVYSDRHDFPKNKLPHLYATKKGDPVALCLNRNNVGEWFAENTVEGFIQTIEEWLFKAGSGLLNTDGNEFDPIRLDNFRGIHAYAYTKMFDIAKSKNSVAPGLNFAIIFGSICKNDDDGLSLKSFQSMPLTGLPGMLKIINGLDEKKLEAYPIFSILCWPNKDLIFDEYDTDFPSTFEEFAVFCKQYQIDITDALTFYFNNGLKTRGAIPIILALKRPKKLIGYDGDIEFLNFLITSKGQNIKMLNGAPVGIQNHIEPFTSELAGKISGRANNKKIMFLGGGALGSKIYLHKLRAGNNSMMVVDNDKLLHHNLVRHALHSRSLGKNKAEALIKEGKDYFEVEQSNNLKALSHDIVALEKKDIEQQELIVDTTASLNIQNWLVVNKDLEKQVLFRAEIVHKGTLGLLYKEGNNRNPRVDDLINLTYYLALSYPEIERWREYDSNTQLENLPIGLGCNSTTTLIADDDISFHAAMFSKLIDNTSEPADEGYIYLNSSGSSFPYLTKSDLISVKPFEVYIGANDKSWSVRIAAGISKRMHDNTHQAKRNETAGVLIGNANYKTKVIHVLDFLDAPSDSIADCACFYRGIEKLPEKIEEIKDKTGGLVGYIGEWHSHPMGLDKLSGQDETNIQKLRLINRKVPIPTLSIIVSNGKVLPFIFE